MDPFGCGPGRYRDRQEQTFSNPIRTKIYELFTANETRPLTAKAVAVDLATKYRACADVSVSQAAYHLACLRDAKLIPLQPLGKADPS